MGLVPGAAELLQRAVGCWGVVPGFCLMSSSLHPGVLATFLLGVAYFTLEHFIHPPHSEALGLLLSVVRDASLL